MKKPTWQHARKILCIRLDYLGDVLMCTPAIRALKQSGQDRHVTLLTSSSGAAAAAMIPEIDSVMTYAAPWMKSSAIHTSSFDQELIETLRSHHFDAAVIFTTYSQSPLPAAMMCYLADIPLRLAHCRENPYQLLTDWVRDPEPQEYVRHEVKRQLDLVAAIGAATSDHRLSFTVPPQDTDWATDRLQALGVEPGRKWILMHPGATAASRRYPPELWIKVAEQLNAALRCSIVFTGGPQEIELVESIRGQLSFLTYSLAGAMDLGKLGAVIKQASVMVSNNTGPAHLAAAIGTPIVDLYALTNPQHTPWQVPNRVLFHLVPCRNCYKSVCPQGHHACLTKIEPSRVVQAVIELLASVTTATIDKEVDKSAEQKESRLHSVNPLLQNTEIARAA